MAILAGPAEPTHDLGGTRFTSLATPSRGTTENSVWFVEIEPGVEPTPHQVTREEVFVVLEGRADVVIGSEKGAAGVGDAFVVPADTPFQVSAAPGGRLRMVCCLPVGGQARTAAGTFTPPWAE